MSRPIEILAPAGDLICLQAALDGGANAVYLGLGDFDMRRVVAGNFSLESLPDVAARCHAHHVKLYLTFNTLIFEDELPAVREQLTRVKPYVDAIIASDWAVCHFCRELGIPLHISTQMSCSNSQSVAFLKSQGASRIVLARECTLNEVARIAAASDVEIEIFVHGAQCLAHSGRCLLSHHAYGHSASRGDCHQPCRRHYRVQEIGEGNSELAAFEVTSHAIFSARDLCSLPFLNDLVASGAAAFKIEGRARNADYVYTVTKAYREGTDAALRGELSPARIESLLNQVSRVYHRDFGCGLFHGRPGKDQFTTQDENQATHIKRNVGPVLHVYPKAQVIQIQIQDHPIQVGDSLSIQGPLTGVVELKVQELRRDDCSLTQAEKGTWVTLPCPATVRPHDQVFRVDQIRPTPQTPPISQ